MCEEHRIAAACDTPFFVDEPSVVANRPGDAFGVAVREFVLPEDHQLFGLQSWSLATRPLVFIIRGRMQEHQHDSALPLEYGLRGHCDFFRELYYTSLLRSNGQYPQRVQAQDPIRNPRVPTPPSCI